MFNLIRYTAGGKNPKNKNKKTQRKPLSYLHTVCSPFFFKPRVHHYSIEKQVDGSYKIPEGKSFPGPVELIEHYQDHMDGFVTQPTVPCDRLSGQSPVAFRGITYHQLEKSMQIEAKKIVRDSQNDSNNNNNQGSHFLRDFADFREK